jgi:K+-sensing histidine kinase KdpD
MTQIKENAKLSADNKMLSLMSSAVSHEMITPLKCIITMAQVLSKKITNESLKYDVELISITSKMLLN